MDGRPNRRNKFAFLNFVGVVWTMLGGTLHNKRRRLFNLRIPQLSTCNFSVCLRVKKLPLLISHECFQLQKKLQKLDEVGKGHRKSKEPMKIHNTCRRREGLENVLCGSEVCDWVKK